MLVMVVMEVTIMFLVRVEMMVVFAVLAPVVRRVNKSIHWKSRSRVDSAVRLVNTSTGIRWIAIYLLDNWTLVVVAVMFMVVLLVLVVVGLAVVSQS